MERAIDQATKRLRRVLFICTGNFYRSRFAEAVFNHNAQREGLRWRAFSRGLAIHMAEGDLSHYTRDALCRRGIDLALTGGTRVRICEADLSGADLCVALKETEHRPMVAEQFPGWEGRVRFWDVSDIHETTPEEALHAIEERVRELVRELAQAQ
jgi:protein-tyrosine phosphatase